MKRGSLVVKGVCAHAESSWAQQHTPESLLLQALYAAHDIPFNPPAGRSAAATTHHHAAAQYVIVLVQCAHRRGLPSPSTVLANGPLVPGAKGLSHGGVSHPGDHQPGFVLQVPSCSCHISPRGKSPGHSTSPDLYYAGSQRSSLDMSEGNDLLPRGKCAGLQQSEQHSDKSSQADQPVWRRLPSRAAQQLKRSQQRGMACVQAPEHAATQSAVHPAVRTHL